MNNLEQLVVLRAGSKLFSDREKQVRAECDAEFEDQYKELGIKKKEIRLGDQTVGEIVAVMAKPKYVVSNKEEFDDFALCNGLAHVKRTIDPWMQSRAIEILQDHLSPEELDQFVHEEVVYDENWQMAMGLVDGEVVLDGTTHIVPGVSFVPEHYKNSMLKGCKPEDVLPAVKRLGGFDQLLLGDASE